MDAATDYTVSYVNNKNVGSNAAVIVYGNGSYTGATSPKTFTISKADNTMTVAPKSATNKVAWSKLRKANQVIKKADAFKVGKAQGAVTFEKASGNSKITVSKAGKVTVKKGLKKNTYKVKVNVKAAGDANYKKATKAVTLKIKVS